MNWFLFKAQRAQGETKTTIEAEGNEEGSRSGVRKFAPFENFFVTPNLPP